MAALPRSNKLHALQIVAPTNIKQRRLSFNTRSRRYSNEQPHSMVRGSSYQHHDDALLILRIQTVVPSALAMAPHERRSDVKDHEITLDCD